MITIKPYQYEDIKTYTHKIYLEVEKMVRNYSSYMAKDFGTEHADIFAELILFKLSEEVNFNSVQLGFKNDMKYKHKMENNETEIKSEIGEMIHNLKIDMEEMISRLKAMKE
jgi:hypothetical protein